MRLIWSDGEVLLLNEPADCDNVGECCFSCPMYDQCDHHYDPEVE